MAKVELIMPKMGESITEATIITWLKQVGDPIEMDEAVLEIATDKVDSEVPSTTKGILAQILYQKGDVVPVGKPLAWIETEVNQKNGVENQPKNTNTTPTQAKEPEKITLETIEKISHFATQTPQNNNTQQTNNHTATTNSGFYSPLVLSIAQNEGVAMTELQAIGGTGAEGRITKNDILTYVKNRKNGQPEPIAPSTNPSIEQKTNPEPEKTPIKAHIEPTKTAATSLSGGIEIVEMDRMRKMIAKNMVESKRISAHVTSFVEVDVTNLVAWREKIKKQFQQREGENFTFTPIFIEAIAKAIKNFPMINISIDGDKILIKKDINIGMAAAMPNGNLIVPIIKNADQLNLLGLAKKVNDLAKRAREGKLKLEEIEGGTYTVSNVGTFGNVMGTPIIPQPQVAIMAVGAIRKKPVVLETEEGDVIAIRHMMMLSHSYDHRVVDGALGGMFARKVGDYLEQFDVKRSI